jgi:hypothetical protein
VDPQAKPGALTRDVNARLSTAEADPQTKPGAPAAAPSAVNPRAKLGTPAAVVLIGLACLLPRTGPVFGQQGDFVGINQPVRAFQNRPPLSQNQASKKLWAWTENGGFPYVEIYHFPVEAGSRYTLVLTYAADKARRRIIITGENPFSDEKLQLPQGARTSYPQDLTTHPTPPDAAPCRETRRFNFTVEAKSNTRGLYLVCLSREPAAALEFRLKFPADLDADVKAYTAMPDCAWLGKIY